MNTDRLLQTLAKHRTRPPASDKEISAWENRHSVTLPESIRAIYRFSNGVSMGVANDPAFTINSLDELDLISQAIFGQPPGEYGPEDMFALIRLHDCNFVALDLTDKSDSSKYRLLDAFHENFHIEYRNPEVVCETIEDFIELADKHLGEPSSYWWLVG